MAVQVNSLILLFSIELGTVIRCTMTKLLEYERRYICNKCHHTFYVQAEFEQGFDIPKPNICLSPEGCTSVKFTILDENNQGPTRCKDYQELKIQEQVCFEVYHFCQSIEKFFIKGI